MPKRAADALAAYRRKRRFERTPEPAGEAAAEAGDSFTIQRHAASRLHYDFRLELDGVLKSWAVPKGPSLDPREKRLAVQVEDHPVAYGTFEGEIPKGEYGGGTVLLWDRGRWRPEGDPREGLRQGKLVFTLDGRKLRGRWALVRLRQRAGDKPNWLLIKERDEFARARETGDVLTERPESVADRHPARRRVWRSQRPSARRPTGRRPSRGPAAPPAGSLWERREPPELSVETPMPAALTPQLCTLVDEPPEGAEWIHEIKFDGYRLLARLEAGQARLFTRRGSDWSEQFKGLRAALEGLPAAQALLDGEIVALDEQGRPDFQALQNALGAPARALYFYAFDLLYLDGRDLRPCPLIERKAVLAALLSGARDPLKYCDHIAGGGADFFTQACKHGLEGIVSKRKDSPYLSARTHQWLKIKCLRRQEFVVGGYTEPKGSRSGFGALLLGYQDPNRGLVYCGKVGTGFNERVLAKTLPVLESLESEEPPFSNPPRGYAAKGAHWVTPKLVVEVAYSDLTSDGLLRQPRFEGLRADKPASEVVFESPKPVARESGPTLSHPERVLYPELGLTKSELARYYEGVAEQALKFAARRPLALVRCPAGHGKDCFYQKNIDEAFPRAIRRVPIVEGGEERSYGYIEDVEGLVALVQMGVLEYHPWGSRVESLEYPDVMTFDLDPGPAVSWAELVSAARDLRDRLRAIHLESWVKTTGGKGLHVVAPVLPETPWERFKLVAKAVADSLAKESPGRFTAQLAKSKRVGRIFIDYLRNGRGATAVAAYSTRARPGAPVSTPLAWDELSEKTTGERFTARTVPARLKELGGADPWKGYWTARQRLP